MDILGSHMSAEISEIPTVFSRLIKQQLNYQSVVAEIKKSGIHNVLILARGTSDNAAHFLKYLIETQLGLPCGLTSPSSVTIYKSTLHFQGTLILAISQSGQSPDLVEYANAAKSAGALIIAFTNDATSPLALLAHHHLDLMAGPELAVAATKSYAAQLLLSYLLISVWAGNEINSDGILLESTRLAALTNLVKEAVALVEAKREIVILGRGFSYPNAREAALKIQETSKISVQGLSTADYMHGPISALSDETQVFIMAPQGIPASSFGDSLARIRNSGPGIIWIGNGGTPIAGELVIEGATIEDAAVSSIVDCIALQRFAMKFAIKNGFNPDQPVGLAKVTMTL